MSISQVFGYGHLLGYEITSFISVFIHQIYLSTYLL